MELCYRYRKEVKEQFFLDEHLCTLFLAMMVKSSKYLDHKIAKVKQNQELVREIYNEFQAQAKRTLIDGGHLGLLRLLDLE